MSKPLLVLLLLPAALAYAGADAPASLSLKQQQDSLARQRLSLHQQLTGKAIGPPGKAADPTAEPAAYFIDPLLPLPPADCERLDKTTVESLISAAAKKQSLDPALLRAVMKQESGFKPCAVSIRGAQGLMQLMPATATLLHVADPFDPEQNVQAGAAFLKQLLGRYKGDLRLALVAYNAGTLRAEQPADVPYPLETQGYLSRIFAQLGINQTQSSSEDFEVLPAAPVPVLEDSQPTERPAVEPEKDFRKDKSDLTEKPAADPAKAPPST
ncbi:MAG TPA: lytic transglycosylase domain-containing protein [Bryobacteraceae bacterium]